MSKKKDDRLRKLGIEEILRLLNSFFRSAEIDIRIIEFSVAREEIVIGFPEQIESFENELKDAEGENLQEGGRYIANVRLVSAGREVATFVRFYRKTDGNLIIEDKCDQEITLSEEEDISKPGRWQKVAEFGKAIAEDVVKTVVEMLIRRVIE